MLTAVKDVTNSNGTQARIRGRKRQNWTRLVSKMPARETQLDFHVAIDQIRKAALSRGTPEQEAEMALTAIAVGSSSCDLTAELNRWRIENAEVNPQKHK